VNRERKPRCPSCGGSDIRHSKPGGILDALMLACSRSPYRCRRCERRFYFNNSPGAPAPQQPVADQAAAGGER